jgi:D-amino-acid oxidase
MSTSRPDVLVIGAGVSGLTTALCLLDAGLAVTVRTADLPQRTTSAVAGAVWGPHLVGTSEAERQWAAQTLDRLRSLAADTALTGVRIAGGLVAVGTRGQQPPPFTSGAGELTECDEADLPPGYAVGWRYRVPVVSMPAYLDYLTGELTGRGGLLSLGRPLRSLAEAVRECPAPVLVNCAGLGARELAGDTQLTPVRGQVVIAANPGLEDFFVGEPGRPGHTGEDGETGEVAYIIPHGTTVLLGGTTEHGSSDLVPAPATAARIIGDCVAAEPRLAGAAVLGHRVGLRPCRPHVRLETQAADDGRSVVHNYGHGGAGLTLSWGCAMAAAAQVAGLLRTA